MRTRWPLRLIPVFATMFVAGCGADEPPSCLPSAASPPPGQQQTLAKKAEAGTIQVYIDVSQSMAGFAQARAAAGKSQPFAEFLSQLPDVLQDLGGAVHYSAFGSQVVAADHRLLQDAARPDYYRTNPLRSVGRITDPLDQAAAEDPGTLSIVVTDLFLSGTSFPANGASPLRRPLAKALRDGRAVGIVGFRAPFQGRIYDLPTNPNSLQHSGERPFFLLLIGPIERILAFRRSLERELLSDLPPDAHRFLLFARPVPTDFKAQPDIASRVLSSGVTLAKGLVAVQPQPFSVEVEAGSRSSLKLPLVGEGGRIPGMPGIRKLDARHQVKLFNTGAPCASGWFDYGSPVALTRVVGGEPPALELFSNEAELRKLPKDRPVFARVEIVATELSPGPELAAALDGWSVSSGSINDVARSPPKFFPALNLDRLATVLAETAVEGVGPIPVGSVDLVFKVK